MALQRLGEADPKALLDLLASWLEAAAAPSLAAAAPRPLRFRRGGFLELRAVAAALAHPPLLGDPAFARQALALADRIMERVAAAAPATRREVDFRVLRQGLGYALSVLAAAEPEKGFGLLERWAASRDPDLSWVIRENLKKKRLAAHAGKVARVSAALGGA
jgi:hypothetical protein